MIYISYNLPPLNKLSAKLATDITPDDIFCANPVSKFFTS